MQTGISAEVSSIMPKSVKVILVLLTAVSLTALMLGVFWYEDWQYTQPTPRPLHLTQAKPGGLLRLSEFKLPVAVADSADRRPLFLHFYNPKCPCSRFNLDHVRDLVRAHGAQVRFVAVIEGDRKAARGLPMPLIADPQGAVARACGVYSTPQAVLLDARGRLVYRGNYNTGRYCEGRATEFARIALENLLASHSAPEPAAATTAYGCQLPSNPRLPTDPPGGFARLCRRRATALESSF